MVGILDFRFCRRVRHVAGLSITLYWLYSGWTVPRGFSLIQHWCALECKVCCKVTPDLKLLLDSYAIVRNPLIKSQQPHVQLFYLFPQSHCLMKISVCTRPSFSVCPSFCLSVVPPALSFFLPLCWGCSVTLGGFPWYEQGFFLMQTGWAAGMSVTAHFP